MDDATIDPDARKGFERLVARLDYPMVIVTAASEDGRRAGCLVGFWTQCGIDPARVLVCLSKRNDTFRVADGAPVLAVHWLSPDDRGLAELFGGETGDDTDIFACCSWAPGPGGVPVLEATKGWVAGPILDRLDAGDHVAFLVEPRAGACHDGSAGQLGFQAVKNHATHPRCRAPRSRATASESGGGNHRAGGSHPRRGRPLRPQTHQEAPRPDSARASGVGGRDLPTRGWASLDEGLHDTVR